MRRHQHAGHHGAEHPAQLGQGGAEVQVVEDPQPADDVEVAVVEVQRLGGIGHPGTLGLGCEAVGQADRGIPAKNDRTLALQALLLDETAVPPPAAEAMLDELLDNSRELLPQFAP